MSYLGLGLHDMELLVGYASNAGHGWRGRTDGQPTGSPMNTVQCPDGLGLSPVGSTRCMNGMETVCQNTGIWQNTGMVGLCGGELPDTCDQVESRKSTLLRLLAG